MDAVLRAVAIYVGLLLVFRLTGKRTIEQVTTFDFVLLLIIAEATQQALLGDDFSVTNAFLIILTLVAVEVGLSIVTSRFPVLERFLDGTPLVVVDHGKPFEDRLKRSRLAIEDILEEARSSQGLERLEQIKFAVIEKSGRISIIPYGAG